LERFTHGYALLIAVNENRMPGLALPTVAKDAAALQAVLTHPERCAYLPENVRLIQGPEASRVGIRAGFTWLKQKLAADRTENATALVFYTGHGARETQTDAFYLLPYDLSAPVSRSALPAAEFAGLVEAVRPRRLLVVLDCCHAGGMAIKGQDPIAAERLRRTAAQPAAADIARLADGRGRAVLSSSTGDEQSYVRPDMSMSIFTYHLVEALTGHARPANGATDVLVSDVMGYVTRTVPAAARAAYGLSQTPTFSFSGENFPVALLLGGRGIGKGQSPPEPTSVEFWPPANGGGAVAAVASPYGSGVPAGAGAHKGGNSFVLSGDFRGSALNIQSSLQNVTQSINAAPTGEAADKAALLQLVAGLQAELEQVPPAQRQEAQAVAGRLKGLVGELDRGDREMLSILGDSLTRAADSLGPVRPNVPDVARQIAAATRRFARPG
jgi:hypothetical protein